MMIASASKERKGKEEETANQFKMVDAMENLGAMAARTTPNWKLEQLCSMRD